MSGAFTERRRRASRSCLSERMTNQSLRVDSYLPFWAWRSFNLCSPRSGSAAEFLERSRTCPFKRLPKGVEKSIPAGCITASRLSLPRVELAAAVEGQTNGR